MNFIENLKTAWVYHPRKNRQYIYNFLTLERQPLRVICVVDLDGA